MKCKFLLSSLVIGYFLAFATHSANAQVIWEKSPISEDEKTFLKCARDLLEPRKIIGGFRLHDPATYSSVHEMFVNYRHYLLPMGYRAKALYPDAIYYGKITSINDALKDLNSRCTELTKKSNPDHFWSRKKFLSRLQENLSKAEVQDNTIVAISAPVVYLDSLGITGTVGAIVVVSAGVGGGTLTSSTGRIFPVVISSLGLGLGAAFTGNAESTTQVSRSRGNVVSIVDDRDNYFYLAFVGGTKEDSSIKADENRKEDQPMSATRIMVGTPGYVAGGRKIQIRIKGPALKTSYDTLRDVVYGDHETNAYFYQETKGRN